MATLDGCHDSIESLQGHQMDRSEAGRYLKGILCMCGVCGVCVWCVCVWCVCVCGVCVCGVCVWCVWCVRVCVCGVCGVYVGVYTQVMQIVQCVKHSWSHLNSFSDRTQ